MAYHYGLSPREVNLLTTREIRAMVAYVNEINQK